MADNTKVFDIINERVLRMLEDGIIPWKKPWTGAGTSGNRPRNLDGRPYSGINAFYLACLGYSDPRFLTYKKAVELGGKVKKGEHGFPVVFWKQLAVTQTDEQTGETKTKRIPMLRYFTVFNVEQCEGIKVKPLAMPTPQTDGMHSNEAAEAIVAGYADRGPKWDENGGDRAYYDILADRIHIPSRSSFTSAEEYYSTLFHEFSHSTGAKSRLDREGINTFDHFGSDKYAREELVAEFGSAFLQAEAGIEVTLANSASYIAGWTKRIKEDPKLLVVAAGRGEKAADYVLGRDKAKETDNEEAKAA